MTCIFSLSYPKSATPDNLGNLLLWSSEQAEQERQRADQESQRVQRLAAKLGELGVDPD
ncbi:hypothetical protein [Microcoleus sp. POL10_C6]|uniref:hypothetical protein n=1 Tax=Microcoleus sp. POL10_C6 TaxID=2818852 RepID=UPI002FD0614A